ncbi:YheC/YheD family protein [Bacillus sp. FJAT-49736]|uniref:YheC/YheD family endospore coat-associated protein n=1 Tax=Bacillus sp. FJAT-49736 TaxID=2833582 RepID=UPI001BCA5ED2|nr:YheC/YheD family protein [Bacillus sp. FJAT-49736]MBS4171877.1 YheC/YheD family protein [Bacillus sp. FJAT-49736]
MITMGILTLIPHENNSYFDEIAKRAHSYGIDIHLFSPLAINPNSLLVNGLYYDSEKENWVNKEYPIPEFLYDRCFYGEERKSNDAGAIVSWLKARNDITFLGYGLPNKWRLYETLIKNPNLAPYLPLTKKASSPEKVLTELKRYDEIILKPINGAHGYAVYSLQKIDNEIKIQTTKQEKMVEKKFINHEQAKSWLERLLTKQIFLIQPRLDNRNKDGSPFDLRLLLQKDGDGTWLERGRAIRTGAKHGLLTNISAGASVLSYEAWRSKATNFNHFYLQNEIEDLIKILPTQLEELFHPLFELGIDIIIAKNQSIWILDINSKPGRKIISLTNPNQLDSLYEAPLKYCQYLASNIKAHP